ncbi:MAG: F0F1 ATP synthase subunit A [Verrucomicrobiota bacterium]
MGYLKKLMIGCWLLLPLTMLLAAAPTAHREGTAASVPTHSRSTAVHATDKAAPDSHTGEHHGLPLVAPRLQDSFISNSMLVTWVVALLVIFFAQRATRQMKAIPDGAQNFWEWMVESLHDLLESIIGPKMIQKSFWFFATIFIFILSCNWLGLLPGFGTIGWGHATEHGFQVTTPLLRGGNADLNMTLAMALLFFALWLVWSIQENGMVGFILHIFGPKGDMKGVLGFLMIFVFLFVGVLELVSIMFRPVSLTFRLFGNIYGGENMLEAMSNLIGGPAWAQFLGSSLIPIPFYFLEVLVGFVQALVFMLLTAVFTMLMCTHEEGHEKGSH